MKRLFLLAAIMLSVSGAEARDVNAFIAEAISYDHDLGEAKSMAEQTANSLCGRAIRVSDWRSTHAEYGIRAAAYFVCPVAWENASQPKPPPSHSCSHGYLPPECYEKNF